MTRLDVRPHQPATAISAFSGGNQQKIVLAKLLQVEARALLLDEPAHVVDAAAKRDILGLVSNVAAEKAAILHASAHYEEIASMCHRVLVFRDGHIAAELVGEAVLECGIVDVCHAVCATTTTQTT